MLGTHLRLLPLSFSAASAPMPPMPGLLSLLANLLSPVKRGPAEILQNSAAALFAQARLPGPGQG